MSEDCAEYCSVVRLVPCCQQLRTLRDLGFTVLKNSAIYSMVIIRIFVSGTSSCETRMSFYLYLVNFKDMVKRSPGSDFNVRSRKRRHMSPKLKLGDRQQKGDSLPGAPTFFGMSPNWPSI